MWCSPLVLTSIASAQSGSAQGGPPAATFQLPPLVVTAQKEPADPQGLPLSLTTVAKPTLQNAGINIVSEAGAYGPNVSFTEFTARKLSNARFRGIGSSPANPSITTFFDGVPQLNANTSSIDLVDVDQIEFVRGPQSALFGRNTLGGLINITSTRPSLSAWSGNFSVPLGNVDARDVRGGVAGPLVADKLGMGVALQYGRRDGYTVNDLTGNDLDSPGYLMSFDPETGAQQWRFYTVPMNPGDPGLETWKSLDAARHGGGHPWLPGVYDPESHLYIFGTGNPTPAYMSAPRGEGLDNLFTCAIVAVNVDTGKMEWYYQTSPHDTHDWDSAQTPVLVDGDFRGSGPRRMVLTASRNGYYFTLDRRTGEHMVTSTFSDTVNWAKPGLNAKGQPVRDAAKDHHIAGALVSAANGGSTNWPPPAFSPDTGLLYVPTSETYAMYYLTETDPRGAMGLGGKDEVSVGTMGSFISAIDYKTGKTVWKHKFRSAGNPRGAPGLLTTAGKLLFGGDVSGNFIAFDPANGNPLWHSQIGQVTNAPETYTVDGRQHILVAAGDTLYSFALYQ